MRGKREEAVCPFCASFRRLDKAGRFPRHLGLEKDPHDPTSFVSCRGGGLTLVDAQEQRDGQLTDDGT